MQKNLIAILRFMIPLAIGVVILYYAFARISFDEFVSKALETDYSWVIGSMLLSILAYGSRAYRWKLLLNPTGHEVSTYRLTLAVYVGYLANMAFPRLGEVTRCAILKKTDDVPVAVSIGTVVTERVIDSLVLLFCLGLAFAMEFDVLLSYFDQIFSKYDLDFTKFIYLGIGGLIFISVIGIVVIKANPSISSKIRDFLRQLWSGIASIRNMTNVSGFLISTLIMWTTYYTMAYMMVFALEETSSLSIMAGFMLLVTGGIALALPVQGGIGTYHAMISMMLVLYGISDSTGIFLATLLHTSQVIAVAIFGGISVVLTLLIQKKKNEPVSRKD